MAFVLAKVATRAAVRAAAAPAKVSASAWSSARCASVAFSSSSKKAQEGGEAAGGDLYDPYKLYEEKTGTRGYREFNPDLYDSSAEFVWEEPEALMEDKSWPATSNELFADLLNVSGEPLSADKQQLVLQEVFRRSGYASIKSVKLPEIGVEIPAEHPDREALEIMKLSLLNNGRIDMDDKEEILKSIVDEIDHVRKDKTVLFKGLE
jgi:hypothetical protein